MDGKQSLLPQQEISFLAISNIGPAEIKMLPTTGPFKRNQFRLFLENKRNKEEGDKTEGISEEGKGNGRDKTPIFSHLLAHSTFKPYPGSSVDFWKVEI